jgi:hypothetical protein
MDRIVFPCVLVYIISNGPMALIIFILQPPIQVIWKNSYGKTAEFTLMVRGLKELTIQAPTIEDSYSPA